MRWVVEAQNKNEPMTRRSEGGDEGSILISLFYLQNKNKIKHTVHLNDEREEEKGKRECPLSLLSYLSFFTLFVYRFFISPRSIVHFNL